MIGKFNLKVAAWTATALFSIVFIFFVCFNTFWSGDLSVAPSLFHSSPAFLLGVFAFHAIIPIILWIIWFFVKANPTNSLAFLVSNIKELEKLHKNINELSAKNLISSNEYTLRQQIVEKRIESELTSTFFKISIISDLESVSLLIQELLTKQLIASHAASKLQNLILTKKQFIASSRSINDDYKDTLEKFHILKEKNIISESEFQNKKEQLEITRESELKKVQPSNYDASKYYESKNEYAGETIGWTLLFLFGILALVVFVLK